MSLYNGSTTLNALEKLTNLELNRMHYQPKKLDKKIKKILN